MCGIVGIIYKDSTFVTEELLRKMTDKMLHRGPDAEGFYINGNFGMGHRRLAIIDTSDSANQPFLFKNKVLTFNGAIYNYIELKSELEKQGYVFSTNSDTEILIASYDYWGEKCVERFNGMWAFAIFDAEKNKIFCSRDRFGIKPFYYYTDDKKMIFASEIKPILEIEPVTEVNIQVMLQFIAVNLTEQTNETFFKGINKLQGSHNLIYCLNTNNFEIYRYYDIPFHKDIAELSLDDSAKLFQQELERSIKLRLRSDVKIGSSLSGGLDSSYLATIASRFFSDKTEEKFNVISVGSKNPDNDESYYSKMVSEYLTLNQDLIYPDKEDFEGQIIKVITTQEEPFESLSIYMQNFLMAETNKLGIKVLLDGQGADEILLGYSRYTAAYLRNHSLFQSIKFLRKIKSHYSISIFTGILSYLYFSVFFIRKLRILFRGRSLKAKYRKNIDLTLMKNLTNSYTNIFKMQRIELFWAQIPELLRFEDKNSMAFSVETRLPFLDYKFVETCLSINSQFKIYDGWSKYILRKNMEGKLPDEITWRKRKIGFDPPTDEWWPYSDKILEKINQSKIIQELYSKKIKRLKNREMQWKLYNIAVWEEVFNMKITN
ncbi:asparagine synthase (glutamine-hydrolyzing) [Chryseobacterium arthrosphaerae]|uniref:asparagine synthase (glutamine-hydrolyzing) n=2 Tax=Chryseobacterium arthrosphaerae TaxID=651561 RepID=UPI001E28AEF0|nr:asparagine synthase (glutamine-hydrolyzing) [Chryseobacterium arthrosphaerae]UEQ78723.1 asparagine synthase (glutamine-hydrolyzing) [Chryseobacterium arthrosphaerae]